MHRYIIDVWESSSPDPESLAISPPEASLVQGQASEILVNLAIERALEPPIGARHEGFQSKVTDEYGRVVCLVSLQLTTQWPNLY